MLLVDAYGTMLHKHGFLFDEENQFRFNMRLTMLRTFVAVTHKSE